MMQMKTYSEVPQEPQIVRQPGGATTGSQETWMSIPIGMQNCPPGLEYLTAVDQLLIHQKADWLEGFEAQNKYKIKNALGQNVYFAFEESDCCARNCYGSSRAFDMKILDNFQHEIMHLYRPYSCGCLGDSSNMLEVYAPVGTLIGTVQQVRTCMMPVFQLKNAAGDAVLRIKGPGCPEIFCNPSSFRIFSLNGNCIGEIKKKWSGLAKELFSDADNFGVTFPMDLDVRMKAIIVGATFLIDMMYFEK